MKFCDVCNHQFDGFGMSAIHRDMPVFLWCRQCGSIQWEGSGFAQTYMPEWTRQRVTEEPEEKKA